MRWFNNGCHCIWGLKNTWEMQRQVKRPQMEFGGIEAATSSTSGMYCTHNIFPILWNCSGSNAKLSIFACEVFPAEIYAVYVTYSIFQLALCRVEPAVLQHGGGTVVTHLWFPSFAFLESMYDKLKVKWKRALMILAPTYNKISLLSFTIKITSFSGATSPILCHVHPSNAISRPVFDVRVQFVTAREKGLRTEVFHPCVFCSIDTSEPGRPRWSTLFTHASPSTPWYLALLRSLSRGFFQIVPRGCLMWPVPSLGTGFWQPIYPRTRGRSRSRLVPFGCVEDPCSGGGDLTWEPPIADAAMP